MATTKEHKVIHLHTSNTLRGLVEAARELDIPRNDIVAIMKEREQYVLIYYYGGAQNK